MLRTQSAEVGRFEKRGFFSYGSKTDQLSDFSLNSRPLSFRRLEKRFAVTILP
jgi:hypothetical protein